jgi:hypothetical protein
MKRLAVLLTSLVVGLGISALTAVSASATEGGPILGTSAGGETRIDTGSRGPTESSSNEGSSWEVFEKAGNLFHGLVFHGVKVGAPLLLSCTSAGQSTGTVVTPRLNVFTGWISKEKNEAGIDFQPVEGTTIATFSCEGGVAVKWTGSIIAHVPANSSSSEQHINLLAEGSVQSPEKFEGGVKDVLESEFSNAEGKFKTALTEQNMTLTKTGGGNFELNTVANPSQPEFGRCQKVKNTEVSHFEDSNCSKAKVGKGLYNFDPAL